MLIVGNSSGRAAAGRIRWFDSECRATFNQRNIWIRIVEAEICLLDFRLDIHGLDGWQRVMTMEGNVWERAVPLVMVWGLNINTSHTSLMSSWLEVQSFENILESGDSDHGLRTVQLGYQFHSLYHNEQYSRWFCTYCTQPTWLRSPLHWKLGTLVCWLCSAVQICYRSSALSCVSSIVAGVQSWISSSRSTVMDLFQLAPFQPDKSAVHSTKAHIGCTQQLLLLLK